MYIIPKFSSNFKLLYLNQFFPNFLQIWNSGWLLFVFFEKLIVDQQIVELTATVNLLENSLIQ